MSNLYTGPSIDAPYQGLLHLAKWFQRRRFFRNRSIRNKNSLWWLCLLTDRDKMCSLYRGPSIDASYHVSVYLAKRFQRRRFFFNWPIRNKNCLWWPCLLADRDKHVQSLKRTFHRGLLLSFSSFGQAVSEEKIFKNRPIKNKNCLWRPCLLTDQDEMCNLYKAPSIDAFYQVSVHLAEWF